MTGRFGLSVFKITIQIAIGVSLFVSVQAQSSQYDKGTPPQHGVGVSSLGSYTSTELGTINLSNGALNFKIPLGTLGGRGGLAIPLSLNYSSKVWSASLDTDEELESGTQQPVAYADYDRGLIEGGSFGSIIGAGWTIAGWPSLESKRVQIGKILSGPNVGCYNYTLTKLTLYLPDRGEIEFRDDATNGAPLPSGCSAPPSRGTRWHATDGSGTIFINDVDNGVAQWPSPNLSGVVITADGTRIRFGPGGGMTDRNGNQITSTDQLGRTITIAYNVPDPDNSSVILARLITIAGYQGTPRYYKIKTGIMNQNYRSGINPALPVITGDWDPENWGYDGWWPNATRLFTKSYGYYAQQIDELEVLTELVLPDGRSLKFKYNEFGEVAEVEIPTGGKIQYDYGYSASLPTGNSPTWETGTNGAGSGIASDVKFVDRAVKERRTYPDGATLEGKWNYGYGSTSTSVAARSSSGALLSDTLHYFLPANRYTEYFATPGNHDGTHYSLWSTGIEWRTEIKDASGAIIAASEQDWTQRAPVVWSTYAQEQPQNDNRVNQARKFLDTGAMTKVETFYDQFNNLIEVKEYDFDQTLKRRSATTYSSTNLVNGTNYAADSIYLIRLPLQQSVYDAGGIEQARTTYEYDVYTNDGNHDYLLPYPSITGHDTVNYGVGRTTRGNPTRIGNWIKSSNSYLYTYPRYDIAGNVISTKDARGFVTAVSFTDNFGNGANPTSGAQGTYGATYAFPTLITSAPPNPGEQPQTARSQYDFSTGLLTGFKDRNGVVTQTIYSDPFDRPTLVKTALGISGVENHAAVYYAPSTALGITLAKNDVLTVKDQNALDDANFRSWTVTDGFGRAKESWFKDPQGDVKTIANYDALGRTTQTSNPFRPSLGETAVFTTTAYDLAGRVVSVTTPDSAIMTTSYTGNQVTVSDQTNKQRKSVSDGLGRLIQVYEDPAGLNYLTSYTYDVLDGLTTVSQGSQPAREFVYDSLKRLIAATNPESGTINYQYDNNGNLLVKTDARGVSAHYEYDALGRVFRRWYNGSNSPAATIHNSPALAGGVGASDEVKYFYDSQALPSGAPTFTRGFATGRMVAVAYGGGSTGDYYGYDAAGRVNPKIQRTGAVNFQIDAVYNRAGAVTAQTYPSARTVTTTYDSAGRTNSVTGNLGDGTSRNYATGIIYSSFGSVTKERFGTTTPIYNKLFYNVRGQLSEIRESTSYTGPTDTTWDRGAIINHYSNTCWGMCSGSSMTDNNGNLKKQDVYIPGGALFSQFYSYDSLNRLQSVREDGPSGPANWQQAYAYDRYGNRTIDQTNTYGAGIPKPNFTVNTANNRLSGQTGTMSYDNAGNLTNDTYTGEGQRTYDAENRMKQAWANSQWQTYIYDGDGRRVKRLVNGGETWQVYGLGGELLAEYSQNGSPLSPQKEYGYRNGQLLITTDTASGGGGSGPQPVTWTNAVGVTVNGNNLSSIGNGWNTAGAVSTQTIASGDGYMEFTASETTTYRLIGLSNGDTNQNYNDLDFAIYLTPNGGLSGYQGTTYLGTLGTYATGDVLRVAVEGGVVKYKKNGTVFYTATVAPNYPLLVDTSLYNYGSTLTNVVLFSGASGGGGGGGAQNASFTNAVGVSVSGNSLTKTAADGWGNAGAVSTQTIASGDGYVEFTASETNTYRLVGLSHTDTNQSYNTLDYAIYLTPNGSLAGYQGATYLGTLGTYAAGDVLRVAIESGVVKYKKNGTVFYTATTAPNYPLMVDTSLYTNGATISNVLISSGNGGSGGAGNVGWTNTVGVNAATNNLTKTAANGWGNAGAVSTQTIASGNGYVQFTASETTTYRMLGLSHTDTNQSYNTLDYAIYLQPNGLLSGYLGATYLGTLGSYTTGDVLRVEIDGQSVKYKKNGADFYTTTVLPNYPLMVDTSLYTNGATITNVVLSSGGGSGGSSAQIYWLVTDHLGTPRMIFDQSGSLANVSRHDYLPFGDELFAGTGGRTTAQGYTNNGGTRQKFTSKERDIETGLDYFGARYYGSPQGRFTSTDPVTMTVDRLSDPQQINLYAYCRNNPLAFVDPTGEIIDYMNQDSRKAYQEYEEFLNKDPRKYASELATINQLKDSDVTYVINLAEKAGNGEGELTTDGDRILININNVGGTSGETFSRNSRFAHEMEHGRQFDSGELSFFKDQKTGRWRVSPTNYDIGDEVKAFQAQQNVADNSDYWTNNGGGVGSRPTLLREFATAQTDDERARVLSRSAYPGRNQRRDSNVVFGSETGYKTGQLIRASHYFGRVSRVFERPK
jgi:RHS repeat-associated protein